MRISYISALFSLVATLCLSGCNSSELTQNIDPAMSADRLVQTIKTLNSTISCDALDDLVQSSKDIEGLSAFQLYKLEGQKNVCSLNIGSDTNAKGYAAAQQNGIWADIGTDILEIYAKSHSEKPPQLCCSIQKAKWEKAGETEQRIWRTKFKLKQADEAQLMFFDTSGTSQSDPELLLNGPNAQTLDIPFLGNPEISISGNYEVKDLYSPELGETRKIGIYTPPSRDGTDMQVVIFPDAESLGFFSRMVDPMITQGQIKPIVMIGIFSNNKSISNPDGALPNDARTADYLPGRDKDFPDRFDQHLTFLFETAIPQTLSNIDLQLPEKLTLIGNSNGGVFVLNASTRYSEMIDKVLSVSAGYGGLRSHPGCETSPVSYKLSAGLYEPAFLASSQVTEDVLMDAGCDVTSDWQAVGHDPNFYQREIYKFLIEEFALEKE